MSIHDPHVTLADTCDVAFAVKLIGGKWKISIIWELAHSKRARLSTLRRRLVGIAEGVLIMQLKELEHDGLVTRIAYPEVPPHVEYELTEHGNSLVRTLRELEQWGAEARADSITHHT